MAQRNYKDWLGFVGKVADIPSGYTAEDLKWFEKVAEKKFPALAPIAGAYLALIEGIGSSEAAERQKARANRSSALDKPLLELFSETELFPKNSDLARFATKVTPSIRAYRFDKMSRGDIAMRILQHLNELPQPTREKLEASMREALSAPPERIEEKKSFLSKWEAIIKEMRV